MLRSNLPAPRGQYTTVSDEVVAQGTSTNKPNIPSYPHRVGVGFVPSKNGDYEDGGAYPELLIMQYPFGMGKPGVTSSTLVAVDAKGGMKYDALAKQGRSSGQIVHTSLADAKESKVDIEEVALPTVNEESETAERTRLALEAAMTSKLKKNGVVAITASKGDGEEAKYVRYSVNPDAPGFQTSAAQRVIKVVEAQVDPMEPARHKIKKVPFKPDTDNVPVLHAPDKISHAEVAAFKIPPVISQWKNDSGFVIALDKRLAADGRGAQEVTINNKFAALSEALYVTEKKAAEDLRLRNAIRRQVAMQEKADKDADLRELAARARMGRAGIRRTGTGEEGGGEDEDESSERPFSTHFSNAEPSIQSRRGVDNRPAWMTEAHSQSVIETESISGTPPDTPPMEMQYTQERLEPPTNVPSGNDHEEDAEDAEDAEEHAARQQREELREQKRQQRVREQRGGRRSKEERDLGRDVSERVALGQHTGTGVSSGGVEATYDSRLFNQSAGLDSGFGADDSYEAYTAPMFDRGDVGSGLYRPSRDEGAGRGTADEQMSELRGLNRFRADKGFKGTEGGSDSANAGPRTEPVQFEKVDSSSKITRAREDVFGIDDLVNSKRTKRD